MSARWDLLNILASTLGARRYLEVGVQDGHCFRRIKVAEKVGVDPHRGSAATIFKSSDEYFAGLSPSETFDLIFVDGLHQREQVHQDILNAWEHLSPGGAILVHDCLPPTEEAGAREICGGIWCGDVWKGWMDARHDLDQDAFLAVVNTDLGCGLIVRHSEEIPPVPPPWTREVTDRADWAFFLSNQAAWLNLISVEDFQKIMAKLRKSFKEPPWEELDSGISEAVRFLWESGFVPTDSGDGSSKGPEQDPLPYPHVFAVVDSTSALVDETIRAASLAWEALSIGRPEVEASFSPSDGVAVIAFSWPESKRSPQAEQAEGEKMVVMESEDGGLLWVSGTRRLMVEDGEGKAGIDPSAPSGPGLRISVQESGADPCSFLLPLRDVASLHEIVRTFLVAHPAPLPPEDPDEFPPDPLS